MVAQPGSASAGALQPSAGDARRDELWTRLTRFEDAVWNVQQECARLDFLGQSVDVAWVAGALLEALALAAPAVSDSATRATPVAPEKSNTAVSDVETAVSRMDAGDVVEEPGVAGSDGEPG